MTTITENEALCMLNCVEYTSENVALLKKELPADVVIGYCVEYGDQEPLMLKRAQMSRKTYFLPYVKNDNEEKKEDSEVNVNNESVKRESCKRELKVNLQKSSVKDKALIIIWFCRQRLFL